MNRHEIKASTTLLEALQSLNKLPGAVMTLFVVDDDRRVVGSLTDGDIRRALIAGALLADSVVSACHKSFRSVRDGAVDPADLRRFRSEGITIVPVLDGEGRLSDTLDLSRQHTLLPIGAILMAGGKGERLRPATLTTPKPLLQIEGKAIIDYNIEALAACGISDITVATGYLAEQVHEHFSRPVAGVNVKCHREHQPLGTIGAVAEIGVPETGDTLVMNSDLITTVSFEDMYLRHREAAADITIAVIPYQVSVPYAILTLNPDDTDAVASIEEKPSYSYYANAGIYIISNALLRTLPKGRRTDATDLVERAIAKGCRVTYYTIRGTWIDVGSPVDFRQAAELMRHHRAMENIPQQ